MSRSFLVIGDTHIHNFQSMGGRVVDGINERCMDIICSLQTLIVEAKAKGATDVAQLGDFFDNAKPSPAVLDIAMELIRNSGLDWYILSGNHDLSSFNAPTAIRPLQHLPNVRIFEQPAMTYLDGDVLAFIPYCSLKGHEAVEMYKKKCGDREVDYAFLHYGVENEQHVGPDYVDVDRTMNVSNLSFHGHEHTEYWSRRKNNPYTSEARASLNVGAFCQVAFADGPRYRHSYLIGNMWTKIQTMGPLFINAAQMEQLIKQDNLAPDLTDIMQDLRATAVYIRVRPERVTLAKSLKDAGLIRDFAVDNGKTDRVDAGIEVPTFQVADPMSSIAQSIMNAVEDGSISEQKAARLLSIAREEL